MVYNERNQNNQPKNCQAEYYEPDINAVSGSRSGDLYSYKTFIGTHEIDVAAEDSVWFLDGNNARVQNGPARVKSLVFATVIRGYAPPPRTAFVGTSAQTFLPYINGCSTRQVFAPERIGDPTLQLLYMPPASSEQEHHIHSTARVVYVLEGSGTCVTGLSKRVARKRLVPGMTILLHPMCPHHFETDDDSLLVLPLHVFSSPPAGMEFNHPMFNGTHKIANQDF